MMGNLGGNLGGNMMGNLSGNLGGNMMGNLGGNLSGELRESKNIPNKGKDIPQNQILDQFTVWKLRSIFSTTGKLMRVISESGDTIGVSTAEENEFLKVDMMEFGNVDFDEVQLNNDWSLWYPLDMNDENSSENELVFTYNDMIQDVNFKYIMSKERPGSSAFSLGKFWKIEQKNKGLKMYSRNNENTEYTTKRKRIKIDLVDGIFEELDGKLYILNEDDDKLNVITPDLRPNKKYDFKINKPNENLKTIDIGEDWQIWYPNVDKLEGDNNQIVFTYNGVVQKVQLPIVSGEPLTYIDDSTVILGPLWAIKSVQNGLILYKRDEINTEYVSISNTNEYLSISNM